ncbi:MAG TPA: HAD family phosphatase [Gammaproteobacteria bacterium]|nr:HAD family phosphatase [Gammaproteobacteria bacterium]
MSKPSIKAILLDYGGVIAEEGFRNGLVAMAREQGLDPGRVLEVARQAVYDSGFVVGRGSEHEFWTAMRSGAGLRGDDAELRQRILDGFILRPWMMERVRRWRAQGYLTGILSDQTWWLDRLDERDRFFGDFDYVFNSYHLGKGKRDPTLFHDIGRRLALAPGEILFVDDLRSNVERARAAGWNAIHYRDRASFEEQIEQLLSPRAGE